MSLSFSHIDQLTPAWLETLLTQAGIGGHVVALQASTQTTFLSAITRLEVTYSPDSPATAPRQLLFKQTHNPREVTFYHHFAPHMEGLPIVRCYGAAFEEQHGYLLLDDLSQTHFDPPPSLPLPQTTCQSLMNLLATIHARWWQHPRLHSDLAPHLEDVPTFVRHIAQTRFSSFVDHLGDLLSPQRKAWYEAILTTAPIKPQQVTFVHGDTHFWNFLYPHGTGTIYLIDWAAWHLNSPASDVAYMLAQLCSPDRRSRIEHPLVYHYHQQLMAQGVSGYSWEQCWLDYRLAVMQHCLWVLVWHQAAPNEIWWRGLENFMAAFEDLKCYELLP